MSDMLFMNYAKVFLSALERLERVLPGVTAAGLRNPDFFFTNGRDTLQESLGLTGVAGATHAPGIAESGGGSGGDDVDSYIGPGREVILPAPSWCKGWRFCDWAGSYRCANTYSPLAGKERSGLLDLVSERMPVISNRDRSENFVKPSPGRWAVTLNEDAPFYKQYLKMTPPEGFHHPIDSKWVLVGDRNSGPIEFDFETVGVPSGGERRRQRLRRVQATGEAEEVEGEEGTSTGTEGGGREQRTASSTSPEETSDSIDDDRENHATIATANSAATTAMEQVEHFDSRVTICKPDFIDRVAFNETSGVRFSIDGSEVPVVVLVQLGLYPGSCVLLDAEVGVGRHTVRVEPLREGEPYVAISHVLYPA